MLTDAALKHLKPKDKNYKVADRDGMYVLVRPSGTLTFQLDYRMNGRRETITFGKYGPAGSRSRELVSCASTPRGQSPRGDRRRSKSSGKSAASWKPRASANSVRKPMADSTRAMRRSIFERELLPVWRNRLLAEIAPDDLRAHCGAIVERGAPATAIHVRDIVKQIYGFAILHGEKVANPADDVGPASIATFVPKDRSLSPTEIRIMLKQIEKVATLPTIRLGMRLYLQTMVRKSELQDATWDEVDFENAVWTIPKERIATICCFDDGFLRGIGKPFVHRRYVCLLDLNGFLHAPMCPHVPPKTSAHSLVDSVVHSCSIRPPVPTYSQQHLFIPQPSCAVALAAGEESIIMDSRKRNLTMNNP
jgi:hypothetical protein